MHSLFHIIIICFSSALKGPFILEFFFFFPLPYLNLGIWQGSLQLFVNRFASIVRGWLFSTEAQHEFLPEVSGCSGEHRFPTVADSEMQRITLPGAGIPQLCDAEETGPACRERGLNVCSKQSKAGLGYCRICLFIVSVTPGRAQHK